MKNQTNSSSGNRGFTLIELLVVIAISAVLAAMGFGAGAMAINKANNAHALSDCTGLVTAVKGYYDDNSTLPDVPEAGTAPGVKTEHVLMNILVGLNKEENPKGVRYFQTKDAKGPSLARAYGGIYYEGENAELFDPWRKVTGAAASNRHYFVMLDTDYDEELEDPFRPGRPLRGQTVVAWCTGKDGKFAPGQETDADNRDNIYSWK
jgi:general secretion pathway protein G